MESNPKTQVVERLKEAQNVLVTVSANPSVDQLAAAIGFTLMMNKLGKHATAVFSGNVPSTLEFLKPEATLEQNTDSLRDFIISLDKAKADKLRYKVEDDFVKIFITPYRTSLTSDDLNFSQGDFNVDVVMALGVDQRDHVDQAILEHGRILHDATVIGVMAGPNQVDVGSINWQDPAASSLCEMLVSISESFQSGLLDGQMATAYLTGIVAETERFSNDKTSPKVMTMSAQLMAAGANQQLIATQLTQAEPEFSADLPAPVEYGEPSDPNEAVLDLHHEDDDIHIDEHGQMETHEELAQAVNDVQQTASNSHRIIEPLHDGHEQQAEPTQPAEPVQETSRYIYEPPSNGGTLTASGQPENFDPSTDPMSATPQYNLNTQEHEKSVVSPLLGVTDDAESVQAPSMPSTETPLLSSDGETDQNPVSEPDPNADIPAASDDVESDIPVIDKLGPEVHAQDTLADIENAVQDFSGTAPHPASEPDLNADAARQAVMDAVQAGGFDANRPDPIQALNAQEFIETPAPQFESPAPVAEPTAEPIIEPTVPPSVPEISPDAPPSVPPPMLPQFPIPGAEVYEPDQDPKNQ